ncbi:hypothetical protein [Emcibacter sp.]|uniref:hypothetical protein n=1 Tax=Emcibacter sp. TaxID=1979954 RepID=UPI003A948D33
MATDSLRIRFMQILLKSGVALVIASFVAGLAVLNGGILIEGELPNFNPLGYFSASVEWTVLLTCITAPFVTVFELLLWRRGIKRKFTEPILAVFVAVGTALYIFNGTVTANTFLYLAPIVGLIGGLTYGWMNRLLKTPQ